MVFYLLPDYLEDECGVNMDMGPRGHASVMIETTSSRVRTEQNRTLSVVCIVLLSSADIDPPECRFLQDVVLAHFLHTVLKGLKL